MTPEQKRRKLILMQQQARAAQVGPDLEPVARPNPDGTYGQAPDGYFSNPATGQMTSREHLRGNTDTGATGSFARGAGSGLTFGLDDEAQALGAYLRGGEDLGRFRLEQARAQQEADREQHPTASLGGQVAGGLVTAIGSAPLAMGKSVAGTMGRGALIGAAEGAAHGAGQGEGVEDRAQSARKGAIIGAGVGGLAPAAVSGAKIAGRAISDPITGIADALMKRGSAPKANRAIMEALRQSGRSADDIGSEVAEAALEGQSEFRLMDALGAAGQRRASGVVRAGGDAATELAEFLEKRQLGQPERMSGFLEDAYGFRGSNALASGTDVVPQGHTFVDAPSDVLRRPVRSAQGLTDDLTQARSSAANAAYDAVRDSAAPVDVRSALRVIDSRIGGMKGSGVAGDGIDAKLSRYRSRLAAEAKDLAEGETARELSDFDRVLGVKQAVQDDIGAAVRAGRNNEARELGKLVSALDEALEGASDSYRAANDGFRDASRVIDAVGEGAQMARPSQRATDTTARFQSMTPEQQAAARVGYGDSLLGRLEAGTAPTTNRAKALQSPKVEAERGAMALDPELLGRRVERENAMWGVQNRALGGSRTADNLSDIEATNGVASGLLGALRKLGNFNMGDAGFDAMQALGPTLRGETDATRALIVRALMSQNPEGVLREATRKKLSGDVRDSIVAALMREPTRRGVTP